jgi:uncharacterized protein (TIGR00725 family)
MKKTITIFGSARDPEGSDEYKFAYDLGKLLALEGYTICNGGYGGTMEASAMGASEAGGDTIGIICEIFHPIPNKYIKSYEMTKTLFERLQRLIELGDAYVVLKGGTGTLLEIAAVWELINKGLADSKPIVAVSPFWEPMINQFKQETAWEGKGDCTKHIDLAKTPQGVVALLKKNLL